MATMPQGVLYCLPHSGVFKLKLADRTVDIPFPKNDLLQESILTPLEKAAVDGHRLSEPVLVDVVLPHTMYGVDYVTLPAIKRKQLDEAYDAKLRSLHKNCKDLVFVKHPINVGKTVTYRVLFVRRSLLDQCKEGLGRLNINVARFIPWGVALRESACALDATLKKSAGTVMLHIGEEESYLAAYDGEILLGGIPVPFGIRALSDNRLMYEKQLYHNESAELLVINAKERAKSTKLTMAIDLDEEIDDSIPTDDEVVEQNPELPDLTVAGQEPEAPPVANAEAKPVDAADADADDDDDDDEGEWKQAEPQVTVKTLKKSAVRVLPKFMRREEPTTPEGYVLENFRMFERRILMLVRDMGLNEYYPKIDQVYVAMPKGFEIVVETMSTENPDLKWKGIYAEEAAFLPALIGRVASEKVSVF